MTRPIRHAVLAAVAEAGGWEPLIEEIQSGVTVGKIAQRFGVSRGFFSSLLNEDETRKRRVQEARYQAADALLEQAMDGADDVTPDKDAIAKARLKADVRIQVARLFDPERYAAKPGAAVHINVQELHLDALRMRQLVRERPAILEAQSEPLGLPAEASTDG